MTKENKTLDKGILHCKVTLDYHTSTVGAKVLNKRKTISKRLVKAQDYVDNKIINKTKSKKAISNTQGIARTKQKSYKQKAYKTIVLL